MGQMEEFLDHYREEHLIQLINLPRKKRDFPVGKYGVRQSDPSYYRYRYTMNAEFREYMLNYYHNKRLDPNYVEGCRIKSRDHARQNLLGTYVNGKKVLVHVKKRQWPGHCELCEREDRKLFYHHWDDSNMSLGLWLCLRCHMFAENADIEGITQKYSELKQRITDSQLLL